MEALQTLTYLTPEYIKKFQCIGSDCEDTCCSLWEVSINKDTYEKYQNIADSSFKESLIKNIQVNKSGSNYASFVMNEKTGNCSMLCNGLCSIQTTLGEEYLSQTCSTYPRVLNNVGSTTEISAVLSCPEISRALLLNPNAMNFDKTFKPSTPNLKVDTINYKEHKNNAIDEVRYLAYDVINDRRFSFQHRLILLGVFFDNADDFQEGKQYAKLPAFINEFKAEVENNSELRDYDAFPQDDAFQFEYLHNTLMENLKAFIWNKRYTECVNSYMRGIQLNNTLLEDYVNTYKDCKSDFLDTFLSDSPHVMENYIKNYIYQFLGDSILSGEKFFDFYIKMVIDYALIKLHLVGIASEQKDLNCDHVVKLIQSYTKNYKFSNKFINTIYDKVKTSQYNSLGYMSLLIK
ncbi:flagellin lysine-N-methylase [Paenibacillus radicis (ex Gao et al. 2016)]|uniref:Lysine-N-methylase n=1 Tax=Paenibacillus radicis (ex Gao et al. 2016) TaxID=1737354 RepID=A0A917HGA8_9BACL|nr:flagellin lysine-N-methylase [Paenibacillus radicis (ex Gao et al. 2016)]GGG78073.1 lysine-N-methylase [Paenibacillus radicis (ex Gao et al. 2016)]